MSDYLARLRAAGVSLWWDGPVAELPARIEDAGVTGVVLDPMAVPSVDGADGADGPLAAAAVVARDAADRVGAGGSVLVTVHPALAGAVATLDEVGATPTFPATAPGLAAIAERVALGAPVAVSHVFGADRLTATLDVLAPATAPSTVLLSLSEVDSETDRRLWKIGTDESAGLRGRLAVANAQLLLESWRPRSPRTRLVLTSTRAMDPYYRETLYVDAMVTTGVTFVLGERTLAALAALAGPPAPLTTADFEQARHTLAQFRRVGVDPDDVLAATARAADRRFDSRWDRLLRSAASSA